MKISYQLSNLFIIFLFCNMAQRIYAQNIVNVAGNGTGIANSTDGLPATAATVFQPSNMAFDAQGNMYIAEFSNHRIRKVNKTNTIISTVAGNGTNGYTGDGIAATSAELNFPYGIAIDALGNIYISDSHNARIRKIDVLTGNISTVAGTGVAGNNGNSGVANAINLNNPYGIAFDKLGNLYIADQANQRVCKLDALGNISTVAGVTGSAGYNGDGIAATTAQLNQPTSVAVDAAGNLYISDLVNSRIRKVTNPGAGASSIITTVAGTGAATYNGDGIAINKALNYPTGITVDAVGNMYISDNASSIIRKVDVLGNMTTIAGNGMPGYNGDNLPALFALLQYPTAVALDGNGNIYIADQLNNRVREIVNNQTLPVTITNFSGVKETNDNLIQWSATNAVNFSAFQLQKLAQDKSAFSTIATIDYTEGQTNYTYKDLNAAGDALYRLAMIDKDGATSFSQTVYLPGNGSTKFSVTNIYPVPANSTLNVLVSAANNTPITYNIINIIGMVVKQEVHNTSGTIIQPLNIATLIKGTYILKVTDNNGATVVRNFTKM